jgi:hypothetical protein
MQKSKKKDHLNIERKERQRRKKSLFGEALKEC